MNLKRNLRSTFVVTAVITILAAGNPALVAEDASSPAPVVRARITAITGKLLDSVGNELIVGSELKVGDVVKTVGGEPARLVIGQAGTSSSIICIQPNSEVSFTKLSPSEDSDYPLLDAELSLRSAQVRAESKLVF